MVFKLCIGGMLVHAASAVDVCVTLLRRSQREPCRPTGAYFLLSRKGWRLATPVKRDGRSKVYESAARTVCIAPSSAFFPPFPHHLSPLYHYLPSSRCVAPSKARQDASPGNPIFLGHYGDLRRPPKRCSVAFGRQKGKNYPVCLARTGDPEIC